MNYKIYINIFIWFIYYIIFTIFLYKLYLKDEWQKKRFERGLIKEIESDYPYKKDKCVFNSMEFVKIYRQLRKSSVVLSAIIFVIVLFTSLSYDLTNALNAIKVLLHCFIMYTMFLSLGVDKYALEGSMSTENYSLLKVIIQPFNTIKNKLISKSVNYEYTMLNKKIKETLVNWDKNRDGNNDQVGVFIIRLDRFVRTVLKPDLDKGLISLYEENLYNLYSNYKEDECTIYIMDDLFNIVPDMLISQLKISIQDLANHVTLQPCKKMSRAKIRREIDKHIKDIKKDARDVTVDEIINDLYGRIDF